MITLHLKISANTPLKTVQKEFQELFPFLKLEFYSTIHQAGKTTGKNLELDEAQVLAGRDAEINLDGNMLVAELEAQFAEKLGIGVQVFRKSGSVWLQTSATDNWTLTAQNAKGRDAAAPAAGETEPGDYQEQS